MRSAKQMRTARALVLQKYLLALVLVLLVKLTDQQTNCNNRDETIQQPDVYKSVFHFAEFQAEKLQTVTGEHEVALSD